ncbi:hypothetical protein B0T24DRAFT_95968 [Lasiosphaeria ovina]|uniref:SET domain-containing protein n=1 Tax=Lasiosphaeria ovina TaxID=92902 RepID=A0AAE0JUJ4_9PEZI|nr:hypothetical protein B0T24DRAFT_95968 [Lasiosphaeria ovina]
MRQRGWLASTAVLVLATTSVGGTNASEHTPGTWRYQLPSPFTCPAVLSSVEKLAVCPLASTEIWYEGNRLDNDGSSTSASPSVYGERADSSQTQPQASGTQLPSAPADATNDAAETEQATKASSSVGGNANEVTQPAASSPSSSSSSPWSRSPICRRVGRDEFCAFTHRGFAAGEGIALITTPARILVLGSQPPLDIPASQSDSSPSSNTDTDGVDYTDALITGKGVGLVAVRPIRAGRRLAMRTASTPAVMVDDRAFTGLRRDDLAALLAQAIVALPEPHQARFLNLSATASDGDKDDSGLARVFRIFATNAFKTTVKLGADAAVAAGVPSGPEAGIDFHSTFTEVSRLNHECSPNLGYYFDSVTLSHKVYAVRDILPGEELTISYVDVIQPRSVRNERLHTTWSFTCSCPRCTAEAHVVAESDDRVAHMLQLRRELDDYSASATPEKAELLVTLYELEGLEVRIYEAYYRAALEWNGVGDATRAMKYARLCLDKGLSLRGPDRPFIDSMRGLISSPTEHWSWRFRVKK